MKLKVYTLCMLFGTIFLSAMGADFQAPSNVGFIFLEEPLDPRSIGMGCAGTALDNHAFSFYNPASPALQPQNYLFAAAGGNLLKGDLAFGDFARAHLESVWRFSSFFTGLYFGTYSVNGIYSADEREVDWSHSSSWSTTLMSLDFGYAAPQWGAGLSINGGMDRVVDTKSFALSVSAGAVCTPVPKHLSLGLAVFNIGATTPYLDTMETLSKGPALPLSVRLGTSWKDSLREISYTAALDVVYRDIDERVLVPVGLEIYPIDFLALRIGKEFNHDTEIFNCGLGIYINYLNLNVDISTVYAKFGEFKYLLSLTYRLIS